MQYEFQFGVVYDHLGDFAQGAWLTLSLTLMASAIGLALALIGVVARKCRFPAIRWAIQAYVEIIRNTPFLVQIFFIFFGLPMLGLRLSPNTAALVAMTLNVTAYAIEILRAGLESIGKGQTEAATALGLSPLQTLRYVILKPAMRTIYPALTSQFILLMLTSSVVSAISANDLTSVANVIGSETFRNFEVYIAATVVYLAIATGLQLLFSAIARAWFSYPINR
jgi:polar amino acid transport system permease protein